MPETRFLQEEIQKTMENPEQEVELTAIVVPVPGASDELEDLVYELDGEIVDTLAFGMLKVSIQEKAIQDLWSKAEIVQAIQETDSRMQVLA